MSRLQKAIVLASVFAPLLILAFRLGQLDAWAQVTIAWTPMAREVAP